MELDERACKRETDPHPGVLAGRRPVDLPEPFEDVGKLPRRNSDPVVLDAHQVAVRVALHPHDHAPVAPGKLDRVGEKVPQDLL